MFTVRIEPWDQLKEFTIVTLRTKLELKEENEYIVYEMSEYGHFESVEYKFKLRKRENYKEYLKDFISINVDLIDLKDLAGTLARFREIFTRTLSLYRLGNMASAALRWHDGEIEIELNLYALKREEGDEVESITKIRYSDEYAALMRVEKGSRAEEMLEQHVKTAVGLYLLFKEYALPIKEPNKT
jgi:hypothetical protein